MKTRLGIATVVAVLLSVTSSAETLTASGTIAAVEPERRRIRLAGPEGPVTVAITDETEIWIDRSANGRKERRGSFDDFRIGRAAEVRFDDLDTENAAWVKLRTAVTSPGIAVIDP
jgi:hypothetical protein